MTLTDRDPADLFAGLDTPLPPGPGPDLDAVVLGGRRRRRRSRALVAAGTLCLVTATSVAGISLLPVVDGSRDRSVAAEESRTPAAGEGSEGRTTWSSAAVAPGEVGLIAQAQIDAVLAGWVTRTGARLGTVDWSVSFATAPATRDGEALVAPLSTGGAVGYLIDQDPATDGDGFLDAAAVQAEVSSSETWTSEGGLEVGALGTSPRTGDMVQFSSAVTPAAGGEPASRDLVAGVLRDGVLYQVLSTGSPAGGATQPLRGTLLEAAYRIADAVTDAALVTGANPDLSDGTAEQAAEQRAQDAANQVVLDGVRSRIDAALRSGGVEGSLTWTGPRTSVGFSTWTEEDGTTTSAISETDRAGWGDATSDVAFALDIVDTDAPVAAADACELSIIPDVRDSSCRALEPVGSETAVALITSERLVAGLRVPIHRVAVAQDGQQVLVEVSGAVPALSDDELLSLARQTQEDLAAANEQRAADADG